MAALLCSSVRLPSIRAYCNLCLDSADASASNVVVQQENTRLAKQFSKRKKTKEWAFSPLNGFAVMVSGSVQLDQITYDAVNLRRCLRSRY